MLLCIALALLNCSLPHKMPEVEPHFASSEFNTAIGLGGGKKQELEETRALRSDNLLFIYNAVHFLTVL